MKNYDIWMEGYQATGDYADATYQGTVLAESFQDACDTMAIRKHWGDLYDRNRKTYWGCRLFDNEYDARKSFG